MTQIQQKRQQVQLALLMAAAFVLRVGLILTTEGYPYDVNCFFAWGMRMADVGPAAFYAADYFCDYPPGYLYVLGWVGKMMELLQVHYLQKKALLLLAFVPTLADVALVWVLYHIARPGHGHRLAVRFAAAAAFCPVLLFNTAVWKQIDSVFALVVVLCFWMLEQGRYLPGAALYGLALAIKPQALLAGPVLAVCFLRPLLAAKTNPQRVSAVKNGALGVMCAVLPPCLLGLPFWGLAGLVEGLVTKYFTTTSSYPYASVNAFNLLGALGANWKGQSEYLWLGGLPLCTWQQLGTVLVAVLTVWLALAARRAHRNGCFSPLLLAAAYAVGVFTFSHRMHERYLIFAAVLLCAAAAKLANQKLFLLAGGLSLTSFINLAVVYCTVGTDDEFLSSAVSIQMLKIVGLAETILCLILLFTVWDLVGGTAVHPFRLKEQPPVPSPSRPQPAWTRREALFLAGLTAAVALVSFVYLGDTTAPQTCVDTNGRGSVQYRVSVAQPVDSIWVYPGVSSHNNGSLTVADEAGNQLLTVSLNYGNPFTWSRADLPDYTGALVFTVTEGQVFEVSLRDAAGQKLLPASDDGQLCALFDEPQLVPERISQLNSFYFDEIYHARTGYESLHGMQIYETTHPPMGKNFMALGIAIFGMTAFGWRFFGTLFGVLMVPVMYLLVRRLTRTPRWAAFAAVLLGLDFMRFTQSRIATIDSYSAFFILLGAYLMVWYCQSVLQNGVHRSVLPMALCGLAFGMGCASKWTGLYAGVGLAVCYFGALWQRYGQLCGAAVPEKQRRPAQFQKEFGLAIGGGVLFFVVIPVIIYILSFLPYRLHDPDFGLQRWWNHQLFMYDYHSKLDATHAFASNWYSWPLDLRPVWYYAGGYLPADTYASIAGFFSPVVSVLGTVAMLLLFAKGLQGQSSAAGRGVMVFYLSQLLPWMLVTRCIFLYHYFPSMLFTVAAAALVLHRWEQKAPKAAKRAGTVILVAAAILFVWFYPVLSGLPVSGAWVASLKWLPSWGFYIL